MSGISKQEVRKSKNSFTGQRLHGYPGANIKISIFSRDGICCTALRSVTSFGCHMQGTIDNVCDMRWCRCWEQCTREGAMVVQPCNRATGRNSFRLNHLLSRPRSSSTFPSTSASVRHCHNGQRGLQDQLSVQGSSSLDVPSNLMLFSSFKLTWLLVASTRYVAFNVFEH